MRILLASILFIPYFIGLSHNSDLNVYSSERSLAEPDTLVKMERTVCFGTCPSYTLSIRKSGDIRFNGKEFVEKKGMATSKMSKENLENLIQQIRESHVFEIPSSPDCNSRYTDMPSVFLTIQLDGKQHSLTHYHGCKGFEHEEELYDLEETIDSLAGVKKWVEGN